MCTTFDAIVDQLRGFLIPNNRHFVPLLRVKEWHFLFWTLKASHLKLEYKGTHDIHFLISLYWLELSVGPARLPSSPLWSEQNLSQTIHTSHSFRYIHYLHLLHHSLHCIPTMSRIDALLVMADAISSRSESISLSVEESNNLVLRIIQLNSHITYADSEIDTMTELLNKNNICINEFEKLNERSFFLDSNLHLNEKFTNLTSFHNLTKEYSYILETFRHHNQRYLVDTEDSAPVTKSSESGLKSKLSISNLNLRPLRCRNLKVERKKSRYRLSAAYTLNPLQEGESEARRDISKLSADTNETYHSLMGSNHDSTSISSALDTHSFEQYDGPAYTESPTFKQLSPSNMELLDYDGDNVSQSSGLSLLPSPPKFDLENFNQFLRPSRIDLRTTFAGAPLKKSSSHDLIFSENKPSIKSTFKFHNPADTIINKGNMCQPTVETISTSTVSEGPQKRPAKSFKDHSASILHQANAVEESPIRKRQPITPRKNSITIFNLLNSPLGSPRGFVSTRTQQEPPRRGSIDQLSKSLTSNFLHLMYNNPSPSTVSQKVGTSRESPPEGIKKLRKGLQDPISIPNQIKSQRLPPTNLQNSRRNSSLHSSIIVGRKESRPVSGSSLPSKHAKTPLRKALFRLVLSESLLL